MVVSEYARTLGSMREQLEMALFSQAFEVERSLSKPAGEKPPPDASSAAAHQVPGKVEAGKVFPDFSTQCFITAPAVSAFHVTEEKRRLQSVSPVYEAISRHLGGIVLWQFAALESGLCSVYPCYRPKEEGFDPRQQVWYRSAFREKLSYWTMPYRDAATGRWVMAISIPLRGPDHEVAGVTSLVVPLDAVIDMVSTVAEVPAGTLVMLVTLDDDPATGRVRARVLAARQARLGGPWGQTPLVEKARWLESADAEGYHSLLQDMAIRTTRVRDLPYAGAHCFWAYGPLPGQGTDFVFIVPQKKVLEPSDRVIDSITLRVRRVAYFTFVFLVVMIILACLLALRFSRTVTKPLEALVAASRRLARGDFDARVEIRSRDEFGDMARVFNQVGPRLKAHAQMRRDLEIAREIQQILLPEKPPSVPGLDIAGKILYSDETGGDLFDFLCERDIQPDQLCVVVGDVSGHGIPAAILMATVRSALRVRANSSESMAAITADINRHFSRDVGQSGQFMTLFLARIKRSAGQLQWVRAGHEPALLYDPEIDSMRILKGGGVPLGIQPDASFQESSCEFGPGQILVIGTDGIAETRNAEGSFFGRERMQAVIRENARLSSTELVDAMFEAATAFRGHGPQEDDLTLVVVKVVERPAVL
jgi:sigma-B regulation protein RsbU (phosphoserine phosphatase)